MIGNDLNGLAVVAIGFTVPFLLGLAPAVRLPAVVSPSSLDSPPRPSEGSARSRMVPGVSGSWVVERGVEPDVMETGGKRVGGR